ncbi:hypothetical protein KRX57_07740 [Weeksellaceae bacterium TAE3-ERU29]|nr:hypothetical protein [Weeksellaceae bacterium TAE3-ERU29]
MEKIKFNNEEDLKMAWQDFSKSQNNTLKPEFIINSINSKSKLSIMEIKSKFKYSIITQSIVFTVLLYLSITGIIHNNSHTQNDSLFKFFIIMLIFIFIFQGILIIRQAVTYYKIRKLSISNHSTLINLKDNYNSIKSYLKFNKYWSSITILVGGYLTFSSYFHNTDHIFSVLYISVISIVLFIVTYYLISMKDKKKYGHEINRLKKIIENAECKS